MAKDEPLHDSLSLTQRNILAALDAVKEKAGAYWKAQLSEQQMADKLGVTKRTICRNLYELAAKHLVGIWDVDGERPRSRADGESPLGRRRGEGNHNATIYVLPSYGQTLKAIEDDPRIGKRYVNGVLRFFTYGTGRRMMTPDELDRWNVDGWLRWDAEKRSGYGNAATAVITEPGAATTKAPVVEIASKRGPPALFELTPEIIDRFRSIPGWGKLAHPDGIQQVCTMAARIAGPLSYQDLDAILVAIVNGTKKGLVPHLQYLTVAMKEKAEALADVRRRQAAKAAPPPPDPADAHAARMQDISQALYALSRDDFPQVRDWAAEVLRNADPGEVEVARRAFEADQKEQRGRRIEQLVAALIANKTGKDWAAVNKARAVLDRADPAELAEAAGRLKAPK